MSNVPQGQVRCSSVEWQVKWWNVYCSRRGKTWNTTNTTAVKESIDSTSCLLFFLTHSLSSIWHLPPHILSDSPPPRSLKSTFPCQMSLISKLVSLLPNQQVYLVWAFFFLWWGRICRSEESSWCWPPPSNLRQTEQENNNCHMLMTRNSKTANGDMC